MIKKSSRRMVGLAVAVSLALVACGDDAVEPEPNLFGPNPRDVEFAASLGIDLDAMIETASGLFYRDDLVGTGELAANGDEVTLTYTGSLVDSAVFDSGELTVTLGVDPLIAGFLEGVLGMQLGGTRTIVIPSNLAYGSQGTGFIPPDAVLVFEITITALVKAPA